MNDQKKKAEDQRRQMIRDRYVAAASRLHHASMLYVGAFVEIATGEKVGGLAADRPGLSAVRDLIDLILLTRAEISGLTNILLNAGVIKSEDVGLAFAEEFASIGEHKARMFGAELFDGGVRFTAESVARADTGPSYAKPTAVDPRPIAKSPPAKSD